MAGIVYACLVPHPPIMVPEIGGGREVEVSSSLRALGQVAEDMSVHKPQTVFIISPHGALHYNAMGIATGTRSRGTLRHWGAKVDYSFNNDLKAVQAIQREAEAADIPLLSISEGTYDLDHGVMVPVFFLASAIQGLPLVPLSFSWLPIQTHYLFGKCLQRAAQLTGRRVAFIASADLSHRLREDGPYGFSPAGAVFDQKIKDAIQSWDKDAVLNLDPELVESAGECGLRSIVVLMGALEGLKVKPRVLSYEGPFGVGYLTATIPVMEGGE